MPTELFRLVDRTYTEVDQRRRNATGAPSQGRRARFELGSQDDETRGAIISDFLGTLYSKLETIAEGHRALHDVIEGIVKREGITDADNLTGGFKELWKLYQNEVRETVKFAIIRLISPDTHHFA